MNDQLLSQLTGIPIAQINTYTPQQRQMAVGMAYDKSGMLKPADRIQGIPAGTFDPEEGMYDAYISQRDAFLGNSQGRQRSKLLKKFNKSFDENWKSTEDMRRNEFEWNRDMSDLNSRLNSITQRIKDQTAASVQEIQNSLNSRQPIQQTPQQPAEQPKAKVKQNTPQVPAGTTTRIINEQEYSVAPDFEEMPGNNNVNETQQLTPSAQTKPRMSPFSQEKPNGPIIKLWNWLKGPEKPIQTNTPSYGKRNLLLEAGQAAYNTFGNAYQHKKGGRINKHQQGGAMQNEQELQKAFMAYLIEDAAAQGMQIQSEQDLQAYAQQLGEEGLKAKYQEFMQKMQGGVKAALGAKLNYIHKLKGNCPEGEELVYMKQGGRVCPVCQKKAEKAKDGKKLPKKNAVSDFKEKRKQINPNDTVNTKFGPRDLNGKTKYPKYNAKKENYNFETRMRVQEKDEKSGKKVIGSACGSKMKKK